MLYAISLIPIILYVAFIKAMDAIELANWKKTLECLVWGVSACIISFFLSRACPFMQKDAVTPLAEEIFKALPLAIAVYRKRSAFFTETLIYGAAVGAGFALLENTLYICFNSDFTTGDAIIRGFGTSLLHMGCTALLSSAILVGTRISRNSVVFLKAISGLVAILPSWGIHLGYNTVLAKGLLPEFAMMIIVVIVIISLFLVIYEIDEKLIHKWLDLCIANDIALYTSVREGRLKDTNSGQYLIQAKKRFKPEVFFDILVYLDLYLEITIAAKSRMIMKDAGINIPLSESEHNANKDKITELNTLSRRIGKGGVRILKPIVDIKAVDEWAMKELL